MHTLPRYASAVSFILLRTMDETSSAEKVFSSPLYSTLIMGLLAWLITVNGQCFMSDCTEASLNFLPIRRLASTMRKQTMVNTLILQDGDFLMENDGEHVYQINWHMNKLLTKNCVVGVHGDLVFGCVADQPFCVCERYITGGGSVTLIVGDDFHLPMLENSNTGICGTKIYSNGLLCWLAHVAEKKISQSLIYKFETKKQIIESINQPILNHEIIFLFIIILKLTKNAIFVDNKTFSPHVMSTCWLTKGWMKILSKLKKMIIFIQLNKISCSTKSLDLTFFKIDIPDVLFLPLSPLLNFTGLLLRPACPDL